MLPQAIQMPMDVTEFANRWRISCELARKLIAVAARLPFPILMISGFRTREEQQALKDRGVETAPDHLSTHRSCPATGADIRVATAVTRQVKAWLGTVAVEQGLRWGGGSALDEYGFPKDWNHLDLGPRSQRG